MRKINYAAIQFCASMLEEVLPYNAVLARMGGDEFAVLLKDCDEHGAINVAKQIITTLSEQLKQQFFPLRECLKNTS